MLPVEMDLNANFKCYCTISTKRTNVIKHAYLSPRGYNGMATYEIPALRISRDSLDFTLASSAKIPTPNLWSLPNIVGPSISENAILQTVPVSRY